MSYVVFFKKYSKLKIFSLQIFLRNWIAVVLAVATFFGMPAVAGTLEDSLLAGAAAKLDPKGVELAIRRGAKPTQLLPHPDAPIVMRTPIQHALLALISNDDPDSALRAERILRTLFKAGANLTGNKDELFPAISGGHIRIVSLLLEQGANPHIRIYGYSPAELAIKYRHQNLLPLFYARGVPKVDELTSAQIEFVHASSNQNLPGMQIAVQHGAKVDDPDPAGSIAITQLLSTPLREPDGYEALKWLLLNEQANPNATEVSDDKSTALHNVIKQNSYNKSDHFTAAAIAEMLISKGADVSSVDNLGRTPLHYAAKSGNVLAMQVLIRNGAKVMARDILRKSPMDMANSGEAIRILRESGARE